MKPFDLQVNGYAGVDFSSLELTGSQLHEACEAVRRDGGDRILATLITDSVENLESKLRNLVDLREQDDLAGEVIAGFHIEGPFLSAEPGYIGAHPANLTKKANIEDARRLLDAAGGLTKVVTLAPEADSGGRVTRYLADRDVIVSAGHTNASQDQLGIAIDQGLSMVTHLGNGCPVDLPRHDNIIQRVLSLRESLWIGFIPDGHHIDFFALKNYLDLVGLDRAFMVTDAISASGLGAGTYELSGEPVEVDSSGVARRPGSPNLSGSTLTIQQMRENLSRHLGMSDAEIEQVVALNPGKAVGENV
ncbi:MAG: N-acetylglucosamine-6-phosphate deacetylase [Verrucomicrobiales bacterium]